MTRVLVSGRVLDAQVGGNTRYARTIYAGLEAQGVDFRIGRVPGKGKIRSLAYAFSEGLAWPITPGKDIDVIHYPADTGAQIKGRIPIVSTVHGLATLHVDNVRSRTSDRIWRQRVSRLVELSDAVITVSNSSAADIASIAPGSSSKIKVIHHGIDHDKFNPTVDVGAKEALRSKGIEGQYFLYVGNLDPRKNLISLCDAAEEVFKKTGIPLLVSGAPAWESNDIVHKVTHTAGVRYLGRVPEESLVALIQGAIGFCFPSSYEGFGFPVLEAMACGTPVITTDRGSLKEVAGGSSLKIESLERGAIASAMIQLAGDVSLQSELRHLGLENAQRFSWDKSIALHAELFKEVGN